jgi:hypothetical protein
MPFQENALSTTRKTSWLKIALLALVSEKIVQHVFVTLAFFFDWGAIRSTVAVNPDLLLVLGALVAVMFGLGLWGLIANKPWAPALVAGLALFDILGEFAAQGTFAIALNVSFVVAVILLVLAILYRRKLRKDTPG